MQKRLAIILDRDGVINVDSKDFIKSTDEFIPYPKSLEAIGLLSKAGYEIYIATNQSGIARGLFTTAELDRIHTKLMTMAQAHGGKIDAIFYCPHGPDDNCTCRKPKPGLILQIQDKFKLDLKQTPVVGDSYRDLQAALSAGAIPVLVKTGNGEKTLVQVRTEMDVPVYESLYDFAYSLIHNNGIDGHARSKT